MAYSPSCFGGRPRQAALRGIAENCKGSEITIGDHDFHRFENLAVGARENNFFLIFPLAIYSNLPADSAMQNMPAGTKIFITLDNGAILHSQTALDNRNPWYCLWRYKVVVATRQGTESRTKENLHAGSEFYKWNNQNNEPAQDFGGTENIFAFD